MPPGERVRPTSDRVREALFDILGESVAGAHVLDAFAGSGALGLEALSRGAREVVLVEPARDVLTVLRANVAFLGATPHCRVLAGRIEEELASGIPGEPFDLVLADPPYDLPVVLPFLRALLVHGALASRARVVVERDQHTVPVEIAPALILERTARYGRTCLDFYRAPAPITEAKPAASADSGLPGSAG